MKNFIRIKEQSVGVRSYDAEFILRIPSVNIQSRILLGKTLVLSLLQRLREVLPLIVHQCQDIVGCTVEDAAKRMKQFIVIVFLKVPDNWNAGTGRCLIQQCNLVFLLQSHKFFKVGGNHYLVCGYNTLPVLHGLFYNGECLPGIIYQLNNQVD